jgi:uncharacterized iron-regulated membrane protein
MASGKQMALGKQLAFGNRKLQDALRVAHLWLGIAAGLFIVMMGLSGAIIIFRSQIEASVAPKTAHKITAAASLSAVAKSLDTLPGTRITRVTFPDTIDGPLLVQADGAGKKHMLLYFDPSTGQSLGEKPTLAWLDWLVDLHQNLLSGKTGRAWAGLIGAALFLISVSGLLSWLAGSRDWKRTLAVPQKGPWRRVNFQAHKWAGLWTNVLLIVVSFTGMVLAWPEVFEHPAVPPAAAKQEGRSRKSLLPLDEYVRAAAAALPGGVVKELRLPSRGSNAVSLTVRLSGDLRRKGANIVLLDPASAKVISVERASAAPLSVKFVELANSIHKTELGGLPVQLAWSLLGLAPALLFVSGLGIWWQRRSARSAIVPAAKRSMARRIKTAAG